ncbi:uncharacterized protein PGTG_02895 [Puccinia graminis f. sp. tritici CRL 75-36-700-3]|uniref:Uncharacterized protein n=1 Tax=Puccinia graminis f. sp. tritici (strain CRL 75-36-700-3 / race SCCL) TaxID=418459 RepID=E3JWM9_PUCGT|nr:uncharacterized protein PGTG_02895 [Puccinia graminis f. sp. tritici CRL 75-36-700-3]EFP76454.2 hypothetical protein PGTG_02895 [Puccinia graminis f. sp. tritici CRL 75-36-700-3]
MEAVNRSSLWGRRSARPNHEPRSRRALSGKFTASPIFGWINGMCRSEPIEDDNMGTISNRLRVAFFESSH